MIDLDEARRVLAAINPGECFSLSKPHYPICGPCKPSQTAASFVMI
jgi:hypothetical protein